MFNLGTFMGMQVGDLVLTAIAAVLAVAFLVATRNWKEDDYVKVFGRRGDGRE